MNQRDINFTSNNPLQSTLINGVFSIIIECRLPSSDVPFQLFMKPILEIVSKTHKSEIVSSISLTDKYFKDNTHSPIKSAIEILKRSQKMPIIHISGKNSTRNNILDTLKDINSVNMQNILAVTGDKPENIENINKLSYVDSVDIIKIAKNFNSKFFVGAVVNPFKYNPEDIFSQYFKLIKKVAMGADFIVTQAGWDMKKFQELRWFLHMRNIMTPLVARLCMPTDEEIKNTDIFNGVHTSKVFASLLQREKDINYQQAVATHLIRLPLMAAGCKLMGYSAIEIVGLKDEMMTKTLVKKIEDAILEYDTWEKWLQVWNSFNQNIKFAPENYDYYIFSNLLNKEPINYDKEFSKKTAVDIIKPNIIDKIHYKVGQILSLEKEKNIFTSLKPMLYGCILCNKCKLHHSYYICNKYCPKNLYHGPCGGTFPDGTCEFKIGKCLFHKKFRIATWLKKIYKLEEFDE